MVERWDYWFWPSKLFAVNTIKPIIISVCLTDTDCTSYTFRSIINLIFLPTRLFISFHCVGSLIVDDLQRWRYLTFLHDPGPRVLVVHLRPQSLKQTVCTEDPVLSSPSSLAWRTLVDKRLGISHERYPYWVSFHSTVPSTYVFLRSQVRGLCGSSLLLPVPYLFLRLSGGTIYFNVYLDGST